MAELPLLVRFQLSGDTEFRVEPVARLKVDGCGGVVLYDREDRAIKALPIAKLERFSIHSIQQGCAVMAA